MPGKTNTKKPAKKTPKRTKAYFGTRFIEVEDSTMINKVYYDPETQTLDAVFKTKKSGEEPRYRYRNVPTKVFAQFVLADSLGKFFNKNIKKGYVVEKVT